VGYVVLPKDAAGPVEKIANATYVSPPLLNQAMIHELIDRDGFEPNLARTCEVLRARRDAMLDGLASELPAEAAWSRPDGGYFLWLDLPPGVEAAALLTRAEEIGVTFVKGTDFYPDGGGEESARLAYSFPSVDEISEGVRRLGALVREAASVPA
jgi:DNA-binding transcriptional MocR family regulator